jgi:uncharacterized protein (TIGR02145 family)
MPQLSILFAVLLAAATVGQSTYNAGVNAANKVSYIASAGNGCCVGRVGDANGSGEDEPTIGDVSTMIDALFISGNPDVIACLAEADINQSGGPNPQAKDITIGDISALIDYLFITGSSIGLAECLTPPVLMTAVVSGITETTAECGGTITSDGGVAVTVRGVCWSTNPTPTIADSKTTDGGGIGSFTSSIIGLTGNTPYYVRAYATNGVGTGYGNEVPFTTSPILPVLTSTVVSGITETTAECGGTITSDGGATVTARGVCWSTNPTPTVADSKSSDGAGIGSFTSSIIDLTAGTPYYVRAYATNSVGTGYGNEVSFSSSPLTVTDIDGNVYQTVTIGTQVWMAANLKVTHYRNGEALPNVTVNATWAGLTTGAYCEYNNDVNNVATYGRLYNWYAAVDSRNIAPIGWHVASDAEWQTLVDYLGFGTVAGGKMKEAGTTHWTIPNTGATNESGFTALPGGYRYANGTYGGMSNNAAYWSSTESNSLFAWYRRLDYNNTGIYRYDNNKVYGISVRCVKDAEPTPVTDIDGNVYQTVTIGTQVWMTENLKVTHYSNGDSIPNVTVDTWADLTTGAYCNYNNDVNNAVTYARLYNWYAVNDNRNIAPAGWHVPSDAEWQTLVDYLGGITAVVGGKMKEAGYAHWFSPNTGATNESGYSALPGGYRYYDGTYSDMGFSAGFWSSTEYISYYSWCQYLNCSSSEVIRSFGNRSSGFSIRCVMD